jgi:hypothetical protein
MSPVAILGIPFVLAVAFFGALWAFAQYGERLAILSVSEATESREELSK